MPVKLNIICKIINFLFNFKIFTDTILVFKKKLLFLIIPDIWILYKTEKIKLIYVALYSYITFYANWKNLLTGKSFNIFVGIFKVGLHLV